jgi:hypothetical protein
VLPADPVHERRHGDVPPARLPGIGAIGSSGVRRPLRSLLHDRGVDTLGPADIAPGKHALLDLSSSDACHRYRLNCEQGSIRPREAVRYEMELVVPSRATPGSAEPSCNLDTPNGPYAGAAVTIGTG